MDTIEKTFLECEELAKERTKYVAYISDTIKRANLLIKDLHVEGVEANYSSDTMSIRLSISENGKIYVNAFDSITDTNINRPLDETKVYYRVYITEHFLEQFIQDIIKHVRLMSESIE
jgi:hypothetical protein